MIHALSEFGAPLMGLTATDLEREGVGLQIGREPLRIDVLTKISGLSFAEAWPSHIEAPFSDDVRCWDSAQTIQAPDRPWEILQLGNCGSPIETAQGWLVLTHGVGVMRTYSIGVLLLDLDDPRVVLARSVDPIITPTPGHREGYVPNVVYTCGGFADAIAFVVRIGFLAEAADHHPDIDIRWRTVTFRLSTHSKGGVTDLDIGLAGDINRLAAETWST